jgi:hypothetical protein
MNSEDQDRSAPAANGATGGEFIIRWCLGSALCCAWQPSLFMYALTICPGGRESSELLRQAKPGGR